jgi:hypothetical protein
MILSLATVSDGHIARLLADPPLVWRVIAPDDPERYEDARQSAPGPSLIKRLFGKPQSADDFALSEGEGSVVDLDKAWHGIHYLLTGTAWEGTRPLDFLVSGGRPVGDIDVGYGPARTLSAADTRAVHEAVSRLTDDDLRSRFDPADMTDKEIYPEIWDSAPEEDDTLGYLLEHIQILRDQLRRAVEQGHGLLLYLS